MRNTNLGLVLTLILLLNLSLRIKASMCWLGQVAGTWRSRLATSTPKPREKGNIVIVGHRDSQFNSLKK